MAAHVLTALNQLNDDIKEDRVNWEHIQSALNLSCWSEDLDLFDYSELQTIVNLQLIGALDNWITDKYDFYHNKWLEFGQPRTREEWLKSKFSL
jgi:hypothetical protein